MRKRMLKAINQNTATVETAKDTELAKLKRAMASVVTSRQDEMERSTSERRRRRAADEAVKALRSRVAYLTTRVEDAVAAEAEWFAKCEVLKGTLELREQHIASLRTALLNWTEKLDDDGAGLGGGGGGGGADGFGGLIGGAVDPDVAAEVCVTEANASVVDALCGLEGGVMDAMAKDGKVAKLCKPPKERGSRARSAAAAARTARAGSAASENATPLQAILAVPRARADDSKMIWQLNPGDLQGAEILHQFQMRSFLSMLQGVPVGARAGKRAGRGQAEGQLPPWQGEAPSVLVEKLAEIFTAWRQRDEVVTALVGQARQEAALVEARALRMAVASRDVCDAVATERAAKQKTILKYVSQILAHVTPRDPELRQKEKEEEEESGDAENTSSENLLLTAGGVTDPGKTRGGDPDQDLDQDEDQDQDQDKREASSGDLSIRLADSCVDDEVVHGVVSMVCGPSFSSHKDPVLASIVVAPGNIYEHTVTTIVLRGNLLTDVGARALSHLVERSQSLVLLDLQKNKIGARGCECLLDATFDNPLLAYQEQVHEDEVGEGSLLSQYCNITHRLVDH